MKMLLHVCCGPCAFGAVPYWQRESYEVLGFFYNPNIHPFLEHRLRLQGAQEMAQLTRTDLLVDETYDPEAWFVAVSGEEGSRCERCIGMRLDRAADEAAARGCEVYSTSLSISPWQDHGAIRARGQAAGKKSGVEFVYEDLRPEYEVSTRLSQAHGIYRQKYCGCLVSEWERYRDR
jgi:predicted adenine nucleotide alpha hydrolase (AANH) superfamily ATPase